MHALPAENTVLFGKYAVEGVLGRGGMGVVLAARDLRTGREVAIKVLEVGGDSNIGRFEREASVVAALESEHLVQFIEAGSWGSMPCIVMERLCGEDFAELSERGLLSLDVVGDCVLQTCEALAHAHGAGVIHRDIKPSNLFQHRRSGGSHIVKVLDFGISKCLERLSTHDYSLTRTSEGVFLGSPRYMSPEQFRNPRRVDGRADLWSLGIVAYRLLSGQFPYPGETSVDVFASILETTPPTIRELGIDVPEEVDIVIRRCLTRKREERYENALELARAFAPFASPEWRHLVGHIEEIARRNPAPLADQMEELAQQRAAERAAVVARQPTVTVVGKDDSRLQTRGPARRDDVRPVPRMGSPAKLRASESTLASATERSPERASDAPPASQTRQTPVRHKAVRDIPVLHSDLVEETALMESEVGSGGGTKVMEAPPVETTVLMASAARTPSTQPGPPSQPSSRQPHHAIAVPLPASQRPGVARIPEASETTTALYVPAIRILYAVAIAFLVAGLVLIAVAVSHGRARAHRAPSTTSTASPPSIPTSP